MEIVNHFTRTAALESSPDVKPTKNNGKLIRYGIGLPLSERLSMAV